jgi:HEAT repeat protein
MKMKTGPLLVVGVLILLVGLTVFLTPAPPPPSDGHDHEHEHEKAADKPKAKEPEKPSLAQIKQMLAGNDGHAVSEAFERLQALVAMSRKPQDRAPVAAYVTTLLKDPREAVRANAVGLLSAMNDTDYRPLAALAKGDPSPNVKEAAITALANYEAGGPVEQLLRELSKHPDAGIRAAAVMSLTQLLSRSGQAGNDALALLLGQFDNDASAKAAMKFVAQADKALPTLIKTLQTSPSGPARHAAAMCIGLICAGYNPQIDKFAKQAQVTHRQEYGHKPSNLAGLEPLIRCVQTDPYAPAREIAAQGLGYLGDERAAKPLAAALKDPDAYVRRRAASALVTVPARSVVPELSEAATRDKVWEVRRFAVEALGWVGDPSAIPALNQATTDAVAEVRRYAAIQLGRIADPASLEALSAMLDSTPDPDPDVRWAAVVALGKLKDRRAEKVLVQALSDPSPQVSNSAERALQRLGIATQEQAGYEG